jgi:polar amino acid transport system substrate-binding protein
MKHAVFALALTLGIGATGFDRVYAQTDARIADLAKAGKLRVALGLGSPVLAVKNPMTGDVRGPAVDLGRALAKRIGVEFVGIEYPRPGAILDGAKTGAWDVAFLVVDPERAKQVDFAPPYMQSDFTYLVAGGSPLRKAADVDRTGVRIAVPKGDASDLLLTRILKHAELVRTDTIPAASELLGAGTVQAQAAPRPVLLAASAKVPGSRVLPDGFAAISWAALVPKDRAGRLAYVREFLEEAKASGMVDRIIQDAGLHGVQVAPLAR